MNNKEKGNLGEALAEKFLKKKHYKILDKNYHASRLAELDIVAMHKGVIIFVEVKTRHSSLNGMGREAVTAAKQKNIRYAASHYLACKIKKEVPCRFDVVEISFLDNAPEITHIENAF